MNFDRSTRVEINGNTEASNQINETTYELPIDTTQETKPSKLSVVLIASCNRKSDPIEIEVVEEGTPKLNSALPSQMEDGKQVDVRLQGEGFGLAPTVTVNGKAIQDADRRNEFEIVIPKSNFPNKGEYKIIVENKGGKKSNEIKVEVTAPTPMKITELRPGSLFYAVGTGLRSDENPGQGTKPFMLFKEAATQKEVCKAGGVQATDSATKDRIYISNPQTSSSTCPLGTLKSGTTYTVTVKKTVGGQDIFSNTVTWTAGGSSTSTSTNSPVITALAPSAFLNPPNPTIEFRIRGRYLGNTDPQPATVYINGKKVDKTADSNFNLKYSSSTSTFAYITLTLSKPATGVYAIEVETKAGKTNTLFLNIDSQQTPRIKYANSDSGTLGYLIRENSSSTSIYLGGDYIVRRDFDWYVNNKKYTSTSSTKYFYQFISSTDFKAFKGEFKAYGEEKTTKKKTNEVVFRAIEKGAWGTVPLVMRGLYESAGSYVGENLKFRAFHSGFVVEDSSGKKGEVLVDGKGSTDFTPTSESSSAYGYVTMKGVQVRGTPGLHLIQMKNPDGQTSDSTFLSVRPTGSLLLRDITTAYLHSRIVRTGGSTTLTLVTEGGTANTQVYFAGRAMSVNKRTGGELEVLIDATKLPVGQYPLWLWDKEKGTSNSILINVMPKTGTGAVPKFYSVFPIALQGGSALTPLGGKVRFFVYGSALNDTLSLVVDKKAYPIKVVYTSGSTNYAIAEVDLSGVSAGKYDLYLQGAKKVYNSPKLKLDIQ